MTQTLRREIIQVISKGLNDYIATGFSYLGEEVPHEIVEKIADDVLNVSGIANSPVARKFRDPNWDLLHGVAPDEQGMELERRTQLFKSVAERLEKGLLRNEFPQSPDAQKVYKWIAGKEEIGESLDTWIKWAMDGKRAEFSFIYHKDPNLIRRDWVQAFVKPASSGQRKFERLSDG